MIRAIVLDSGPLALLVHQRPGPMVTQCIAWLKSKTDLGVRIYVPEIVDYELRRELLRLELSAAINDLDAFSALAPDRFLRLTSSDLRKAAELWAQARKAGRPTSHQHELDVDVILSAQAISLGLPSDDFVVATSNVGHISRFVRAAHWSAI